MKFPAITWATVAARLAPIELDALAIQGSVAPELRPSGASSFKLRWRVNGRQRVVYLGSDPDTAAGVQAALAELQSPRRARRAVARILADARARLRAVKRRLAPDLAEAGYHYHGYSARRTRSPGTPD